MTILTSKRHTLTVRPGAKPYSTKKKQTKPLQFKSKLGRYLFYTNNQSYRRKTQHKHLTLFKSPHKSSTFHVSGKHGEIEPKERQLCTQFIFNSQLLVSLS